MRGNPIFIGFVNYLIWGGGYLLIGKKWTIALPLVVLWFVSGTILPQTFGSEFSFLVRNLAGIGFGYDAYREAKAIMSVTSEPSSTTNGTNGKR